MAEIGAFEAKTHFSALLERAARGEEIVITKRGKPIAKIGPAAAKHDAAKAWDVIRRIQADVKRARTGPISTDEIVEWIKEGRKY